MNGQENGPAGQEDVWRLCQDFQRGRFAPGFHVKPATLPDTTRDGDGPSESP